MLNTIRAILYKTYRILFRPIFKMCYYRLVKPIFEIKDSPHSIALGLAVGLWISLTPTVGIQMTLALIVCTLLRANVLIAVAMCWVSNPITFVPMYYGYYRFGLVVMNNEPTPWDEFKKMIQNDCVIVSLHDPKQYANMEAQKILKAIALTKARLYYNSTESSNYAKLSGEAKQAGLQPPKAWGVDVSLLFSVDLTHRQQLDQGKITEKLRAECLANNLKLSEYIALSIKQKGSTWLLRDSGNNVKLLLKRGKSRIHLHRLLAAGKVIAKALANNGYAFTDRLTYLNFSKKQKATAAKILIATTFHRKQTFLDRCWTILAMGTHEFALPLWIGSLIIATALSLPAYPITYHAIVRFRSSLHKFKESPNMARLKEKTRKLVRISTRRRKKKAESDTAEKDSKLPSADPEKVDP